MTAALDLGSLNALEREHLHVFVAGPGKGEGIAVALPGEGWLLVDGCTTADGKIPLEEIVTRFRVRDDEPVLAMVLTHPHDDHAGGFAELIDSLRPRTIALAGLGSGKPDLRDEMKERLDRARAGIEKVRTNAVLAAFAAIERWEESHPGSVISLHDGLAIPVPDGRASVVARAPDVEGLAALLANWKPAHANHVSIVLELEFGATRVVLSGDLPRYDKATSVPTGWDLVMARRPELGEHTALKIPHHGSAAATHPSLMRALPNGAKDGRAWVVTPYNSSRLPRVADLDGLPQILSWKPCVLLTAVPASKAVQAVEKNEESPGLVKLEQLVSRVALQPTGHQFLDSAGVDVTPGDAVDPMDPIWCVAMDNEARLVGRWRGQAALELVP